MGRLEKREAQYVPVLIEGALVPLMNDTKWAELRLAMLDIEPRPIWSSVTRETNYRYGPDSDWFYHFCAGPYSDLLFVDIETPDPQQRTKARAALKSIHLPGEETADGFRVLGYAVEGQAVSYI